MKTHLFAAFSILAVSLAHAAGPPGIFNHQGRIAENGSNYGSPAPQTGYFKFALGNGSGTTSYWTNSPDTSPADGEPDDAVPVLVTNGHYSLGLGDIALNNMTSAIPATIFEDNDEVYLCTWFSPDNITFEELLPKRRLTSAPYALHAATAEGVIDGAVSGLDLPDGSATNIVSVTNGGSVGIGTSDPLKGLEPTIVPRDTNGTGLSGPVGVAVQGNFAYVVDFAGVFVFDVSDPDHIAPRGSNPGSGAEPAAIAVEGNQAYVVHNDGFNILEIYDVSDPDNVIRRDNDSTGLSNAVDVAVQGSHAYVVGPGTVAVFDVSNPNDIVAEDTDSSLASPIKIAVQGSHVFVLDSGNAELAIFDVSDPENIVPKATDGTGLSSPRDLAVQGNFAYVTDNGAGLAIFDIADPDNIIPMDSYNTDLVGPNNLAVQGRFAYVSNQTNQVLAIFDVSDPDNIVRSASGSTGLPAASDLVVQGLYAYATIGSTDTLEVFEIAPRLTVDGSLRLTGNLVDSMQSPGTSGQVLSTTGAGTEWIDLPVGNATDEIQTLSLLGDDLSISGGNTIDLGLDQFLLRNGSEPLTGDLTVIGSIESGGDITLSTPKTGILQLSAADFTPLLPPVSFSDGYFEVDSSALEAVAPVHLPIGATVLDVTIFVYDDHASRDIADFDANLSRRQAATTSIEDLAVFANLRTTGASTTIRSFADATIDFPTISNQFAYWLFARVAATTPTGGGLRFYGARITYRYDTITP